MRLTSAHRIPLERGRDIALQYGVAPLPAPLFDFVPNANPMGSLPASLASVPGELHFASSQIDRQIIVETIQVWHHHLLCPALHSAYLIKVGHKDYSPHPHPVCLLLLISSVFHLAHIQQPVILPAFHLLEQCLQLLRL